MHLSCSQKDLSTALTIVSKAVDVNNTLPVLNNVLLKAEGDTLHFTGTNLEVVITYHIKAKVEKEGVMTLPAKLLTNYVNYLKDDQLELVGEGQDIELKTSDSKTKIKGISPTDFPPIPLVEQEGQMKLKADELRKALSQVVFAAAMNTTRPILGGVFFCLSEGQLKIVATDSYRLSERKMTPVEASGEVQCIIPAKTVLELVSVLDTLGEAEITLITSKNQILFRAGAFELISRLIEGQFPNYQQIIPKESKTQVEVSVRDLSLILKRINIFAKENNNKVILKVSAEGVLVTTESTQYGEGEIHLKTKVEGENNEIALNSQFLLEVVAHAGAQQMLLEIGGSTSAVLIKNKDDADFLHIIMPLKI